MQVTTASQRPQFKALLGQIRNGETLVVSKLDRLGRDAHDVGATIKALTARKIEVIVLQLGKLDLTSPAGKLMLNMLAAVAEMERDLLVERTQADLARAKSEGKTLGRPAKTTYSQRAEIIDLSCIARGHRSAPCPGSTTYRGLASCGSRRKRQPQEKRTFILRSKTRRFDAEKAQENSSRKSKKGSIHRFCFSDGACYSFTHESLPSHEVNL